MVQIYRRSGWRTEGDLPDLPKFVLAGAPHTSNFDFIVFVGTLDAFRRRARFMGKHSLFRWPLGDFMRGLGGIPVDRSARHDMVQQMADAFAARDEMVLVIAPEGTRGRSDGFRTGFYHIALAAGVPIVLAGPDYRRRRGVIGPTIWPTGDYARDMAPAWPFFQSVVPRHPERANLPSA